MGLVGAVGDLLPHRPGHRPAVEGVPGHVRKGLLDLDQVNQHRVHRVACGIGELLPVPAAPLGLHDPRREGNGQVHRVGGGLHTADPDLARQLDPPAHDVIRPGLARLNGNAVPAPDGVCSDLRVVDCHAKNAGNTAGVYHRAADRDALAAAADLRAGHRTAQNIDPLDAQQTVVHQAPRGHRVGKRRADQVAAVKPQGAAGMDALGREDLLLPLDGEILHGNHPAQGAVHVKNQVGVLPKDVGAALLQLTEIHISPCGGQAAVFFIQLHAGLGSVLVHSVRDFRQGFGAGPGHTAPQGQDQAQAEQQ